MTHTPQRLPWYRFLSLPPARSAVLRYKVAEKKARLSAELELDPGMPLARLVAEANKQLGITEPQDNVITQLDALLTELVG